VTAWAAAHMLAETPVGNTFALASAAVVLLRTETEQPVDDLMLVTGKGGIILAQIKRSIDAGASPRSPLAAVVAQAVRQIIRSRQAPATAPADRPWERALDPDHDRIAVVSRSLPAKLDAANRLLRQLRATPTMPLNDLGSSEEERSVISVLREHVTRLWQVEAGATAQDADTRACLLPLAFVGLDVEASGRDEAMAKTVLQQVLRDHLQIDTCWSELGMLAGALISRRGGAERSTVQTQLETRGIKLVATASYRADIDKLHAYGLRTVRDLAAFAGLRVGEDVVRIPRAVVDKLFDAAANERSLLVRGDPGAGKSGAMHDLAKRLDAAGRDVVVLAVDRIVAASMAQLRAELNLEHDLIEVLANWPGDEPGYLIIDALDAARARETAQLVRDLLRQLIESNTRWRVIASIREFDLENSPQLQALFAGISPGEQRPRRGAKLRDVTVPPLTDEELQDLWTRAPAFAVVFQHSDHQTRDLLRIPFNLRLFADLFTAGVGEDELTAIRTRAELLEGYWKWRVLGEADPEGDARETVLRTVAANMIEHRSLRAVRSDLPDTLNSAALTQLYSNGVLATWPSAGAAQPDRAIITFSHHVLFDYAASRLLLRGTPETLIARLTADPEFILSFRPSAVMHFEYLWLRENTRTSFWGAAVAVTAAESLPAIAKTVAPSVAVAAANVLADFDELLRMLAAAIPGAEHAVRHVFGALLAADRAELPLVGTPIALWSGLVRATAVHLTSVTSYAMRPTLSEATDAIDTASESERTDLWTAAAALLAFVRAQTRFDEWLAVQAVRLLCRTYTVDPAATRNLLQPIIDPAYVSERGTEELYWIAREIERIIPVDPDFVRNVYEMSFAYRVLDDREMSLGGGSLLSLTTSARQHHESILHSLAESFAPFLLSAPQAALRTVPSLIESHLTHRESTRLAASGTRFSFLGTDAEIREDGSYIWDAWSSIGSDLRPILDALEDYLAHLEPNDDDIALLRLFGSVNVAAAAWRRLLRAAAKSPERLGRAVIDLAVAEPILYAHDTTTEAGRFITAVYPHVSPADRENIERAILRGAADQEEEQARAYLRDRLLGSIPGLVATPDARARIAAFAAAGGPPKNSDLFRISGGAADYTDEDYLQDLHVPVKSAATQRLLALTRPVETFTRESLNSVPETAAVERILPTMRELDAALQELGLHDEARDYGWGYLAEAAERLTRIPAFGEATFAAWVVQKLREATQQRQPLPEEDSAFKTPGWGSPAARLNAAQGWMRIARYARFVDEVFLAKVRALASDPTPSVRFQVARDLSGLYRTAPDTLWELIEHFGENEKSLGVLQGFMATLQVIAPRYPTRIVPVVTKILERVPDEKGERSVRDAAFNVIAGLYIWQGNHDCEKLIAATIADLQQRTGDCSRIAGECGHLLENEQEAPADVVTKARGRALVILDSLLAAAQTAMQDPDALSPDVLREVASCITHVGLIVYRTVGVDRGGAPPSRNIEERYARVRTLLPKLAPFGVPMLAHYLLSVVETLVPVDPRAMFQLVDKIVESARRYGYEYESEAVRIIVRLLKRYMAEYPDVVRSPDGQKIFLRTLNIFVEVGWPDARRLSYHLEEAFR
jgi:hypothetical protein